MCTFSVVTVVYNDADRIVDTVESVLAQDEIGVQHIIVDGNSSDGTLELLAPYKHLTVVSEPDTGIFDAMNKGLALVENDYVIFMNAGDLFFSGSVLKDVRRSVRLLRSRLPDMIYGDSVEFDRQNLEWSHYKKSRNASMINYGMICHHQAIFYSSKFLSRKGIKYDLSYRKAGDYAFTASVLKQTSNFLRLPLCICRYEIFGVSQTEYIFDMVEPRRVKLEILRMHFSVVYVITCIQLIINAVKFYSPTAYHFFRYKIWG